MKILIICSHPDDEVIGCGGAISKHSEKGDEVYICVVSEGVSGQFAGKDAIKTRRSHANLAGKVLGIKEYFFHDFPHVKLDTIPQLEVNKVIESVVNKVKPEIVYTHFSKDLNKDHCIVHDSTLVACRPSKAPFVKKILMYEIFGSTQWLNPNCYVDITRHISKKLKALSEYKTEVAAQTRSIKSIKTLAAFRGNEVNVKFAEGFKVFREVM